MRNNPWPILLLVLFLAGCEGGDSPTGPIGGMTPADPKPLTSEQQEFLPLVFSAGYLVAEAGQTALYTVTEALYTAADLAGTTVTTGTLVAQGGGRYQYLPTPTDRLVIQGQDFAPVEIEIQELALSGQVEAALYGAGSHFFLADVHQALNFRITAQGVDLTIASVSEPRPGGSASQFERQVQRDRSISGTITLADGNVLAAAVTQTGTRDLSIRQGQSDATEEVSTLTGTATWNGHAITVRETARWIQERDVSSLDGTPQYTVQNLLRSSSGSGVLDGQTLSFAGASVRSESRNGVVNQPDFWAASGVLQRDGGFLGSLRLESAPQAGGDLIRLVVDLTGLGQDTLVLPGGTLGG